MNQISTKDIQEKKLELLRAFQGYCKEEGLQFYMAYGSLIGCIREHGFIPWDEDIDLYMMREDFNKLLNVPHNALGEKYFIQNYKTDKYFYVPMLRICINGTYRCEKGLEKGKFNKGTFIDIFPLDSVPNDETKRDKLYKEINTFSKLIRLKTTSVKITTLKSFILTCVKFALTPFSFVFMQKIAMRRMQKYSIEPSDYIESLSAEYGPVRESYEKKWFKNIVYRDFETLSVPCPEGYDELLTHIYGKYMQRPSKENRKKDSLSYYLD